MLYILKQRYLVYSEKSIIYLKILKLSVGFYQRMEKVVIMEDFVVIIALFVVINVKSVVIIGFLVVINVKSVVIIDINVVIINKTVEIFIKGVNTEQIYHQIFIASLQLSLFYSSL